MMAMGMAIGLWGHARNPDYTVIDECPQKMDWVFDYAAARA
jgi:hypothetical protein